MNASRDASIEFEIILLCCRTTIDVLTCRRPPDPAVVLRIRDILDGSTGLPADLSRVVSLCRRHQAGPAVWRGLAAIYSRGSLEGGANEEDAGKSASVAKLLMEGLRDQYLASALLNEGLKREVRTIAGWFVDEGIRAVPFKGPVMSFQLYGDVAVRPGSDLDFIVHNEDLIRARDFLAQKGYRPIQTMTNAEDRIWRRAGWGYDMICPGGDITVDLACGATPDYLPWSLGADKFWSETREIIFDGKPLRVMSSEMLLIFLCWHGTKHLWEKLIWVADVQALVLQPPGLDWEKLPRLAAESRSGRMVETGLDVVSTVFGSQRLFLAAEERALNPLSRQELVSVCVRRLTGSDRESVGWWREQEFYLRMWGTTAERIWYVLRSLIRPTISDCRAIRLPDSLFSLYYIIRPFRLIVKAIGKTMRK